MNYYYYSAATPSEGIGYNGDKTGLSTQEILKGLKLMFVGMENLVNDNIYKTKYLTEYEGNADDEEMTKEDD